MVYCGMMITSHRAVRRRRASRSIRRITIIAAPTSTNTNRGSLGMTKISYARGSINYKDYGVKTGELIQPTSIY